jgi:hypothetical protein
MRWKDLWGEMTNIELRDNIIPNLKVQWLKSIALKRQII